jgi:hypothetical protein
MTDIALPSFLTDPPLVVRPDYGRNDAPLRWLEHLGLAPGFKYEDWIRQLAEALAISQNRITAILEEADFRVSLKKELLIFDPVPHETDARRQYMDLAILAHRYSRRYSRFNAGLSVPAYFPALRIGHRRLHPDSPGFLGLRAKSLDWQRTWSDLAARNPPLELRERMEEAFRTGPAYEAFGWPIGGELRFYEWLTGDNREPAPSCADTVPPALYKRLCELRAASGGWWYWSHEVGDVVWVNDAQWQAIAANWTYGSSKLP